VNRIVYKDNYRNDGLTLLNKAGIDVSQIGEN